VRPAGQLGRPGSPESAGGRRTSVVLGSAWRRSTATRVAGALASGPTIGCSLLNWRPDDLALSYARGALDGRLRVRRNQVFLSNSSRRAFQDENSVAVGELVPRLISMRKFGCWSPGGSEAAEPILKVTVINRARRPSQSARCTKIHGQSNFPVRVWDDMYRTTPRPVVRVPTGGRTSRSTEDSLCYEVWEPVRRYRGLCFNLR